MFLEILGWTFCGNMFFKTRAYYMRTRKEFRRFFKRFFDVHGETCQKEERNRTTMKNKSSQETSDEDGLTALGKRSPNS